METLSPPILLTHLITGTGEHGVGVGKKIYLTDELGESTVALMRKIKAAVDPQNIMNPGKVSPSTIGVYLPIEYCFPQLYPDEKDKKEW